MTLPGTCVYYSGTRITAPGINTGDLLNIVINKLVAYIDAVPTTASAIIPIVSSDFEPDGITCLLPELEGIEFEIFLNDANRFVYNEVGNQEWDYEQLGGFTILIPGFDANTIDYHLYIFPRP